jgi:hypothetical protein
MTENSKITDGLGFGVLQWEEKRQSLAALALSNVGNTRRVSE